MKLVFVYNADSGMVNTVKDIGHKLFSPSTYDCFLCSLTHGTFRENEEWKKFRTSSSIDMTFLHRDEFEETYKTKLDYPVILREDDTLSPVISKEKLASFSSLAELIAAVSALEAKVG